GTRHAPAQAQMAVGAPQANRGHGPRPRGTAHEARRRAWPGAGGVASDRHRGGSPQRHVQLRTQSQKAAPSAAARRTLSPAHQSVWTGACRAVAVLYPARRGRGCLQDHEGRSATAPDLPSTRRAHRGAHLRRLPGLLSARHVTRTAYAAGARPHSQDGARQTRRRSNARRAIPNDRWPNADLKSLYRVEHRPKTSGQATQPRSATTAAPTHLPARKYIYSPNPRHVVETFVMQPLILLAFFSQLRKLG